MIHNDKMPFTEQMLEIGGVRTHVYTAGQGEPLLWLHGAGGISSIAPLFAELAGRYKIYMADHPGFGLSDRPEWLRDFTDYNYFYRDFLDYFAIDKVNLAGHSLGGRIAVEFAVSHTHRVNKLVMIAAAGTYVEGMSRPDPFMLSPQERIRFLYYNSKYAEQALSREATEKEQEIAAKNLTTQARVSWERNYNPKFPHLLKYITVPTCIVWGENDRLIPLPYGREYEKHIKQSKLHVIPECGHMPHIEQKDQCIHIIEQFIG